MSLDQQANNQIPYTRHDNDGLERQVIDTLEWLGFFAFIAYLIHHIRTRHHYASGIILLFSSVAGFLVLINSNYGDNSFMVWSFWTLAAVAFVSLAKAIS